MIRLYSFLIYWIYFFAIVIQIYGMGMLTLVFPILRVDVCANVL